MRGTIRVSGGAVAALVAFGACSTDAGLPFAVTDHATGGLASSEQATGGLSSAGGSGSGGSSGTGGTPIRTLADPAAESAARGCGNGVLDAAETCDDGNLQSADGCSVYCQREPGWECPEPGKPCRRLVCGDGIRDITEACDDGNTVKGDGCSSNCQQVEPGWRCLVAGAACVPVCGDGATLGPEQCDDGNTADGDGCSGRCLVEPGASCADGVCQRSVCGNGVVEPGEQCDLGEDNGKGSGDGRGCSFGCTLEPICERSDGGELVCPAVCGNGALEPGEPCDDGNPNDGDGCSRACVPEAGFTCTDMELEDRVLSECVPQCGDGIVVGSEACDEGSGNHDTSYGGCKSDCTPGPYCGDGRLDEAWEECDDGVRNVVYYNDSYKLAVFLGDDDAVEPGCTPSCTLAPYCGDYVIDQEFGEMCDLGPDYYLNEQCDLSCALWPGP